MLSREAILSRAVTTTKDLLKWGMGSQAMGSRGMVHHLVATTVAAVWAVAMVARRRSQVWALVVPLRLV
jgi:hypothetical protein